MIDRVLVFLRDQLNEAMRRGVDGPGTEDAVVFVDGDKLDPLTLKTGAINALLVNLERDAVMRRDDPFMRQLADGSSVRARPDVRLNLHVLFVARFQVYEAGLAALSAVLGFFQSNPVFDGRTAPGLDPRIGRLMIDLHTLPLSEQNDLWGSLRLAYHPSLLFKVRMLVVEDADIAPASVITEPPQLELAHAEPAAR